MKAALVSRIAISSGLAAIVGTMGCFNPGVVDDGGATADAATGSSTTSMPMTSSMSDAVTEGTSAATTDPSDGGSSGTSSADTTGGGSDDESSGEIVCEGDETACDGQCVNLQTDTEHCGSCGHGCLGGECSDGVCEAVQLLDGLGVLTTLEISGTHIFVGGDGVDVVRVDKDGGNMTILHAAGVAIEDREWCYTSAITETHVVWGNDWVHTGVRGCALPDCPGGSIPLVSGSLNLHTVAYDSANGRLYFDQGTDLMSSTVPAAAAQVFAAGQVLISSITTDGDFVYWVDIVSSTNKNIRKRAVGGGSIINLAPGRVQAIRGGLAVTSNAILWGEDDTVLSAPLPNGIGVGEPTVIGTAGGNVYGLVVDDTHVYWSAAVQGSASLQRCPLDGCGAGPEILHPSSAGITYQIVLDDEAAYWATSGGAVFKIAK